MASSAASVSFCCRLCSAACPVPSSLYYVEHYGAKHVAKLSGEERKRLTEQQQQSHHNASSNSNANLASDKALLCRIAVEWEEAKDKEALAKQEAEAVLAANNNSAGTSGAADGGSANPNTTAAPLPQSITADSLPWLAKRALKRSADDAHQRRQRPIKRLYVLCAVCKTVFVPDAFLVSSEEEKAEYDLHENNGDDAGYRAFLSRAVDVVVDHFEGAVVHSSSSGGASSSSSPSSAAATMPLRGLDFGCGPGPTICNMLAERNTIIASSTAEHRPFYHVTNYDKYYAHSQPFVVDPNANATVAMVMGATTTNTTAGTVVSIPNRYRFITSTEVVEHLATAGDELRRLWALLASPQEVAAQNEAAVAVDGGNSGTTQTSSVPFRPSIMVIMTKRATIYGSEDGIDIAPHNATSISPSSAPLPPPISTDTFAHWHYKNDPTHITFFTLEAFAWCRDVLFGGPAQCKLTIAGQDVVTFEKI